MTFRPRKYLKRRKQKRLEQRKMIKMGELNRFIRNIYALYDGDLPSVMTDYMNQIVSSVDNQQKPAA